MTQQNRFSELVIYMLHDNRKSSLKSSSSTRPKRFYGNLVRESHVPIKSLLNFKLDRLHLLYFLKSRRSKLWSNLIHFLASNGLLIMDYLIETTVV